MVDVEITQVARPPVLLNADGNRLGEILARRKLIDEVVLADALLQQREKSLGRLGEILVMQRTITEEQLAEALGEQLGFPVMGKIDHRAIPDELINQVPINFAKQFKVLPLGPGEDGSVRVAASDPLAIGALDDLAVLVKAPLSVELAASHSIIEAINFAYDRGSAHATAAMEEMDE